MPERIAVQRLIVGEGKNRRVIMPGEHVTLDSETAAMLDRRDPQVVRDPRSPRPEIEMGQSMNRATTQDEMERTARAQVERVAEPDGDVTVAGSGSDNITREEAPAGGGGESEDAPL